jgi:hypothetical protein
LPFWIIAGLTCACTAPQEPLVVSNPDASVKMKAIKKSAESKDMSQVREIVKELESDDPAVRFFAISGLEKLTGQTFGYQYFADEDKRALAVGKWKAWLEGWEAGQKQR